MISCLWISPDPIPPFASLYAYSPNPLNGTDPDVNIFNPFGALVGAEIGLRNMYGVQITYFKKGGARYFGSDGLGLAAYGASVVTGGFSIAGENVFAIAGSTALVCSRTAASSSMLGQKTTSPNSAWCLQKIIIRNSHLFLK